MEKAYCLFCDSLVTRFTVKHSQDQRDRDRDKERKRQREKVRKRKEYIYKGDK